MHNSSLIFSPTLGILIGLTLTMIIIVLLIIIRIRRSEDDHGASPLEQKFAVAAATLSQNTTSSMKPLLRSTSPRESDERDPDVIPAKFGEQ